MHIKKIIHSLNINNINDFILYLIEIGQFKAALILVSLNNDIPIIATDGAIVKGVI